MPSRQAKLQFYADECFPITSVTFLKSLGYSVIHAYDIKFVRKSDPKHLLKSKELNRVLLTTDRDFLYYSEANLANHPGVIVISSGSVTAPKVNTVCSKLFQKLSSDLVKSSLVRSSSEKMVKFKDGEKVLERKL
ncbi:MAG TPA: DUF5615 family PIN-like protein [Candidatus Nanoarchaeia archaeon]|nr:hypothetical protein [uncultured archaeon]